jgi:uncharacterized membrane protein
MAQGTGQTRRQRGSTEKASGKKPTGRSRGGTTSRGKSASASKSSSNGRASSSAKASTKSVARKAKSPASRAASKAKSPARKAASKAKSPARRAQSKAKQAQMLLRTGRKAAKAVAPLVKRVPAIAGHARAAAAPAGATGLSLATAAAAAQTLRRKREPDPPLQRLGQKLADAATSIPRPARATHRKVGQAAGRNVRRAARRNVREARRHIPDAARPSVSLPNLPRLPHPSDLVPKRPEALLLAAVPAGIQAARMARRARRLPIQRCVDIAVPVQVAYDEWMRFEFLPEGAHTVENIERAGDGQLSGKIKGPLWSRKWEAEIRDERDCESFAWRSVKGSDCAGLITFHELGERLTRLELQLDIIPLGPRETAEFALHLADARARNELRRFKARLETISPDAYTTEGMS